MVPTELYCELHVKPYLLVCFFPAQLYSFFRNTIQTQILIHVRSLTPMNICTHTPIPISTFKRLGRFDLEIHKVGHQERLTVDGDVAPLKK
jgi:hypothetical protein